jgi:hypothetical protein
MRRQDLEGFAPWVEAAGARVPDEMLRAQVLSEDFAVGLGVTERAEEAGPGAIGGMIWIQEVAQSL